MITVRQLSSLAFALVVAGAAARAHADTRTEYYAGITTREVPLESTEIPAKVRVIVKLEWNSDTGQIIETVHRQPVGGDRPEYNPLFGTGTYVNAMSVVSIGPDSAVFFAQSPSFSGEVTYFGAPWAWTTWVMDLVTPFPTEFGVFDFPVVGGAAYTGFGIDLDQSILNPFTGEAVFAFETNLVHVNQAAYDALVAQIVADLP